MLTRTGLLIVLALVALFLAGCGGVKDEARESHGETGIEVIGPTPAYPLYENALEVNQILNQLQYGFSNCKQIDASKIGANNSIACEINYMNAFSRDVEISTFDGDAKEACENNGLCNQTVQNDDVAVGYLHNALIILDADDGCNENLCGDAEETMLEILRRLEKGKEPTPAP